MNSKNEVAESNAHRVEATALAHALADLLSHTRGSANVITSARTMAASLTEALARCHYEADPEGDEGDEGDE